MLAVSVTQGKYPVKTLQDNACWTLSLAINLGLPVPQIDRSPILFGESVDYCC